MKYNRRSSIFVVGASAILISLGFFSYYKYKKYQKFQTKPKKMKTEQKQQNSEKLAKNVVVENGELLADKLKEEGNIHFKEGQIPEAIVCYGKAISISPEKKEFYGNRAIAYIKNGNYKFAIADAEKMILLDPRHPKGHHLKGLCHLEANELEEARSSFEKALSVDPNNIPARLRLNECNEKLKSTERAINPENFMKDLSNFLLNNGKNAEKGENIPKKQIGDEDNVNTKAEEGTTSRDKDPDKKEIDDTLNYFGTFFSSSEGKQKEEVRENAESDFVKKEKVAITDKDGAELMGDSVKSINDDGEKRDENEEPLEKISKENESRKSNVIEEDIKENEEERNEQQMDDITYVDSNNEKTVEEDETEEVVNATKEEEYTAEDETEEVTNATKEEEYTAEDDNDEERNDRSNINFPGFKLNDSKKMEKEDEDEEASSQESTDESVSNSD